ncbi:hypothetical protein [Pandoraea sp. NPDC090278]|uniref:hypothetical protein n=1 Tax=Pandoraea sp. NPDC090278 TaxID=3364391 RepID=UPI00383BA040
MSTIRRNRLIIASVLDLVELLFGEIEVITKSIEDFSPTLGQHGCVRIDHTRNRRDNDRRLIDATEPLQVAHYDCGSGGELSITVEEAGSIRGSACGHPSNEVKYLCHMRAF